MIASQRQGQARDFWHRLGLWGWCALLLLTFTASAKAESIAIKDAWMRAVPPVASTTAAYMTISNTAESTDRILSAASPIAGMVEVHNVSEGNGVMRMAPAGVVEIPAGGQLQLTPGGYHFMMMNLTRVPSEGEVIPLTIRFEQAGELTLQLPVKRSGGVGMSH